MPAPRRPWPPSRPLALRESACGLASRPRPLSPSSSRDPSRTGNVSSTWRALMGCGCGVNGVDAWRRGGCGCGVDGVKAWSTVALGGTCGGEGVVRRRRRLRAQAAAQSVCAGGAGAHGRRWASARARRRRLGVQAGGGEWWRRGRTAAVWRDGGGAKGRRRRLEMDAGETEEREAAARARLIYDRWDPRFSLTPVDPTPRV